VKVAIEEPAKWERVLTVEVPAEDVARDLDDVYREYRDRAALPGFRRGKAPRHVIKARFGKSIHFDLLERIIPRAYRDALEQEQLVPVSEPEFESVNYEEDAPLSFQARVKVAPRVAPTGYRGMALRLDVEPVAESHVAENLESIRERHADFVPVERESADGDIVMVDYERLDPEGKPADQMTKGFPVAIGDDSLVPEFARAMRGAKAGDERAATVEHTHAEPHDGAPEGTPHTHVINFRLFAREVREKRLPPLDDALAQKVETRSGDHTASFGTLDELRQEIQRRLGFVEEARARQRMADAAIDRLVDQNVFEVPDFLVDQLLEGVEARKEDADPMIIGDREEKTKALRVELRPRAERRVRRSLLLSAIAREEKLAVSREEVSREVVRIARREGRKAEEVWDELEKADALGGLRERLLEGKVVEFIVENGVIERGSPAA